MRLAKSYFGPLALFVAAATAGCQAGEKSSEQFGEPVDHAPHEDSVTTADTDRRPARAREETAFARFKTRFEQLDRDDNLYLDRDEAADSVLLPVSFATADRNGDGRISPSEYWQALDG